MAKLVQVDFKFNGLFGDDMAKGMRELAESITHEPGFIWKIWTESEQDKEGGGVYLFEDDKTAASYLEMHTARLKSFGIDEVNGKIFDVNTELSKITKGPIS